MPGRKYLTLLLGIILGLILHPTHGYAAVTLGVDSSSYVGLDAVATLTVVDSGANKDGTVIEYVYANVRCTTHNSLRLCLEETGPNTGVFTKSFGFCADEELTDKLRVINGGTVSSTILVIYTDSGGNNKTVECSWKKGATKAPDGQYICFDNRIITRAVISGEAGAVPPVAAVEAHSTAVKEQASLLDKAVADGTGAFTLTFDNSALQLPQVYVFAQLPYYLPSGPAPIAVTYRDSEGPQIIISGIPAARTRATVRPEVEITDLNSFEAVLTLNGNPFVSGTEVEEEGAYELRVRARDAVGNEAELTRCFTIDRTGPAAYFLTPAGSHFEGSAVEVAFAADDEDLDCYWLSVDEEEWLSAGKEGSCSFTGLSAGAHFISLKAVDDLGNEGPVAGLSIEVEETDAPSEPDPPAEPPVPNKPPSRSRISEPVGQALPGIRVAGDVLYLAPVAGFVVLDAEIINLLQQHGIKVLVIEMEGIAENSLVIEMAARELPLLAAQDLRLVFRKGQERLEVFVGELYLPESSGETILLGLDLAAEKLPGWAAISRK